MLMDVIYASASSKSGQCILSPVEILQRIPLDIAIHEEDLEPLFYNLSLEGYFDFEKADFKGDPMFLFTLKEKGLSYERDKKNKRRSLIIKIVSTVAFALLAALVRYIVGLIIGK
ncbi:MAG: hypothetical protein GX095_02220 [Clostridiales bacterium]|nr:hypothetical protein [Clostridiales bacterium]